MTFRLLKENFENSRRQHSGFGFILNFQCTENSDLFVQHLKVRSRKKTKGKERQKETKTRTTKTKKVTYGAISLTHISLNLKGPEKLPPRTHILHMKKEGGGMIATFFKI